MPSSDQEMQDQRTNSGMEDSNTMTIEFLRARLLSERSVSKSARQRADELARRVVELEEQLKLVSLQRKKAEKATADVLAILENNGISEISDSFDSGSDQETPCDSEVGNNFSKEEENSVDSKFRRNASVEYSGSGNDFSPVPHRGLSWNGRRGTKQSLEKYKDSYLRRRSSFASTGSSSPKNRVGKSCRQIRRRESKSAVEELKTELVKVDSQENGGGTSLEVDRKPEILRGSEAQEEQYLGEGSDSGCFENEKLVTGGGIDFNGCVGDKDMEKALEDQAQLIGRYEEMEKAQREWEERFRENNSSTPDSCDPGNQSDVTEEREESKVQVQRVAGTVNSQVQEAKTEVHLSNQLSNTKSNGFLPPQSGDQKCSSTPASEPLAQDFAFTMSNEKQNQESLGNNHYVPSHSSHHHLHPHGSPENQSSQTVSSNTGSSSRREVSGSQSEQYALVPHETSSGFNEVLEALKQARLSLRQKMSSLPSTESRSVGKVIEPSLSASTVWDRVEIPVGCSGLFRVPTDYAVETSKANFLVSDSRPSLANYNPTSGIGLVSDDQTVSNSLMDTRSTFAADNFRPTRDLFLTGPSTDTRSSYSAENRLLTRQYSDTRSRVSMMRPSFDSNLDAGLPSSRQYMYPNFSSYPDQVPQVPRNERLSTFLPGRSVEMSVEMPPILDAGLSSSSQSANPYFSSFPDLMPQIPTQEGLSTLRPSRSAGMPPANHLPFHNDHTRPYMYR
ncbi:hypothetical protein AB3S75_037067 [Citrus x aurantiifolia]